MKLSTAALLLIPSAAAFAPSFSATRGSGLFMSTEATETKVSIRTERISKKK